MESLKVGKIPELKRKLIDLRINLAWQYITRSEHDRKVKNLMISNGIYCKDSNECGRGFCG